MILISSYIVYYHCLFYCWYDCTAHQSGQVHTGAIIRAVNGTDVCRMTLEEVVSTLKEAICHAHVLFEVPLSLLTYTSSSISIPPLTRAPRPGFEPGFDSNRPGYIHTGSGILVVNNITTGAKYKQITDKLRSSDSRLAPLRLMRSAMDLYLFLRAFIFCWHYMSVRWKPCLARSLAIVWYTALFLAATAADAGSYPRSRSAKAASSRAQSTFVRFPPFLHTCDTVMT